MVSVFAVLQGGLSITYCMSQSKWQVLNLARANNLICFIPNDSICPSMQGLADHVCKKKAFQGFMMVIGYVKMLFKTIVRNRTVAFKLVLFFISIVLSSFLKLLSTLYQMIQCLYQFKIWQLMNPEPCLLLDDFFFTFVPG